MFFVHKRMVNGKEKDPLRSSGSQPVEKGRQGRLFLV